MGACGGGDGADEESGVVAICRASGRFESVQRRKNRSLYTAAATFAGAASKGARRLASGGEEGAPRELVPPWLSLSDVADRGRWIQGSEG